MLGRFRVVLALVEAAEDLDGGQLGELFVRLGFLQAAAVAGLLALDAHEAEAPLSDGVVETGREIGLWSGEADADRDPGVEGVAGRVWEGGERRHQLFRGAFEPVQGAGAGDGEGPALRELGAVEPDAFDAVRIVGLCEAHGDGRAGVPDRHGRVVHGLGAVQVAEGDVVQLGREDAGRHALTVAHLEAPFGVRQATPGGEEVAGGEQGLARGAALEGRLEPARVPTTDPGDDALVPFASILWAAGRRQIVAAQEGEGEHPGGGGAGAIGHRDHQGSGVAGAPDHGHPERLEHRPRGFDDADRVVVAGDDDGVGAALGVEPGQEAVVQPARRGRGVGVVEDIAGYQQQIGVFSDDLLQQPVQEPLLLREPALVGQTGAEVPVCGVEDRQAHVAHRGVLDEASPRPGQKLSASSESRGGCAQPVSSGASSSLGPAPGSQT